MRKPNLIIAGTVKGGTTSLFEYFGRHPDIGTSRVKETCFFLPVRYEEPMPPFESYLSHFSHCTNERYVLESTPGYLDGGNAVASCLREQLGDDVRIIFSLRSPVERLLSFYRYKKSVVQLPKDISFDDYLEKCQSMPREVRRKRANDAYWGVDGGRYIDFLPGWFDVFGADRIKVVFFDDLKERPQAVTVQLANWLGIDSTPFLNAVYGVENKTVPYKFSAVHKVAIGMNRMLEPVLRRQPALKKAIRNLYYFFNAGRDESGVTDEQKNELLDMYAEDNRRLAIFLRQQGYVDFPAWLA